MAVHTIHIFDRKGKTLFTKRYYPHSSTNVRGMEQNASTTTMNHDRSNEEKEQLSEQSKLVYEMV
jgi:hypothetical protein